MSTTGLVSSGTHPGAEDLIKARVQGKECFVPARKAFAGNVMPIEAGAGITAGTGTIYKSGVARDGGLIRTQLLLDLTGLASVATDLDIIGVSGSSAAAHIGQITEAINGTILAATMKCLEVPAGGEPNIALYSATEGTGLQNGGIAALTETLVVDPAADWTLGAETVGAGIPAADEFLYLVAGDATGTNGTYTAGKFLIELLGY